MKRKLAILSFPIFIETLMMMTLGAVDTFMLSRYSDNSVAAVGLVNQLLALVFLVFEVVNVGTSILCAQYLGARQHNRIVQTVGVALIANFVIGLLMSTFLYLEADDMLALMGLRDELMPDGLVYMRIVGLFAFTQAVSFTLSASLRSADMAKYPMIVTFFVNIINIIGNYTLIFGKFGMPALGVEGAAISTSMSRILAMCLLYVFMRRKHIRKFNRELFSPFPWIELRKLFRIGVPTAGEQISYSLSQVVITYFINMLGNEALAARAYCSNIVMFVYLLSIAVGQGGSIMVGHLVGARKYDGAYLLGRYVLIMAVSVTATLSLAVAFCGGHILSLLTSNSEIIAMGVVVLWVDVLLEVGRAINICSVNALRSAGDIYFPVTLGIISMWLVSVVGSYLLGITFGLGLAGMWFAFLLDENIRGVVFIFRWRSRKWSGKRLV